jgi:hypothetical protein
MCARVAGTARLAADVRIRTIAARLTPAEIDGLAKYYRAGFR